MQQEREKAKQQLERLDSSLRLSKLGALTGLATHAAAARWPTSSSRPAAVATAGKDH